MEELLLKLTQAINDFNKYLKNEYSKDYISSRSDIHLQIVLGYFNNITCHLKKHDTSQISLARFDSLLTSFTEDTIEQNEINKLKTTEKILNMYFSSLSRKLIYAVFPFSRHGVILAIIVSPLRNFVPPENGSSV